MLGTSVGFGVHFCFVECSQTLGSLVALLVLAKSPQQGNVHCDRFAIFGPMNYFLILSLECH